MKNFRKATWHGLTGPENKTGNYGLSFCMGDGAIIRLLLSEAQAHAVRDALNLQSGFVSASADLATYQELRKTFHDQPDNSSGKPARDVSSPLEGE